MYDHVLRLRLPKGAQIIRLDDDIALVISEKHLNELVRTCNTAIGRISSWIARIGLKLDDHKTDVLLISSRKRMEFITIMVGDQRITSNQAIKYLGEVIDNRLTFRVHLTYIGGKCEATSFALVQTMVRSRRENGYG